MYLLLLLLLLLLKLLLLLRSLMAHNRLALRHCGIMRLGHHSLRYLTLRCHWTPIRLLLNMNLIELKDP